jgi:hypothetical protein
LFDGLLKAQTPFRDPYAQAAVLVCGKADGSLDLAV